MSGGRALQQTWRWYGPRDPVTLRHVRQAGAGGVVTALHDTPTGEVWPLADIQERKALVEAEGLTWAVVESIPVHEAIKQGKEPERTRYIENYRQSIANIGACGIKRLCYNFMPVIDWTRTDLELEWSDSSHALAFDIVAIAVFELHILKRKGAEEDYDDLTKARATERFAKMSEADCKLLSETVTAGLPGRTSEALTLEEFRTALEAYRDIDGEALRSNLRYFIQQVIPACEQAGVYLAIHPDDPPMPLLGLPRVVSTESDIEFVLASNKSVYNGLTFCVGSYGSNKGNQVEKMAEKYAGRTHFVHMRNVHRLDEIGSFVESDHLDGDVDMFQVMRTFTREAARRAAIDATDLAELPFRPDHGHKMLDDLDADKVTNPGYTGVGRLRGLAELRGLMAAILRYENVQERHG